jgi:LPXTG-motif cell wall-anchored protein
MKRRTKPITRVVIKKYFGKDAKVYGFGGHYRVVTPSGGEVSISQKKINTIYGGEDVYRAVVLLAGECWGGLELKGGSRESMLASMAHGEALGVNVQPNFEERREVVARWFSALLALIVSYVTLLPHTGDPATAALGAMLAAMAIFVSMRRKAKRKAQRKLETSGFLYPRQTTGAGYADEEQLRKGGLI